MRECPTLTNNEFQQIPQGRWPRDANANQTIIPWTRELGHIPLLTRLEMFIDEGWFTVNSFSAGEEIVLKRLLSSWEDVCAHRIQFKQEDTLDVLSPGITFMRCDNLTRSEGFALLSWDFKGYIHNTIVCLPSLHTARSPLEWEIVLNTVGHEIGHAIGIGTHPHEIQSIAKNIRTIPEGLSCSIMTYVTPILSKTTFCRSKPNCGEYGIPIGPGPLDREICQRIYAIEEPLNVHNWRIGLTTLSRSELGFVTGCMRGFSTGLLSNLQFHHQRLLRDEYVELAVQLMNLWLFTNQDVPEKWLQLPITLTILNATALDLHPSTKTAIKFTVHALLFSNLSWQITAALSNNEGSYFSLVIFIGLMSFDRVTRNLSEPLGRLFAGAVNYTISTIEKPIRKMGKYIFNFFNPTKQSEQNNITVAITAPTMNGYPVN